MNDLRANDLQVGGSHYKDLDPEPWDVICAWNLGFLDGNAVKYIARARNRHGIEDLKKAQHYLSKLIETLEASFAAQAAIEAKQKAEKARQAETDETEDITKLAKKFSVDTALEKKTPEISKPAPKPDLVAVQKEIADEVKKVSK